MGDLEVERRDFYLGVSQDGSEQRHQRDVLISTSKEAAEHAAFNVMLRWTGVLPPRSPHGVRQIHHNGLKYIFAPT